MNNNPRTILCPCCHGKIDPYCPLCEGQVMITQAQRREWVAVGTLIRFDDLPIPGNLEKWRKWIEEGRRKTPTIGDILDGQEGD